MARVSEQAERFEDVFVFLNEALDTRSGVDFTVEGKNLLSVGFKSLIV